MGLNSIFAVGERQSVVQGMVHTNRSGIVAGTIFTLERRTNSQRHRGLLTRVNEPKAILMCSEAKTAKLHALPIALFVRECLQIGHRSARFLPSRSESRTPEKITLSVIGILSLRRAGGLELRESD